MHLFINCLNCPRRTVEPSCKGYCETYKRDKALLEEIKANKNENKEVEEFIIGRSKRERGYKKEKLRLQKERVRK